MADISVEQNKGGNLTWLWATLAILAVVGLMAWLASQDVDPGPVAVEEGGAAAEEMVGEAVDLPAVAAAPEAFMGRPLVVRDAQVAATLGPRAFWADIPGANPFLVVVSPEEDDPEVAVPGQPVNLLGTVETVTPEVVDQWVQQGMVNEAQREEASFATHYLLATEIAPGQGAAAQPAPAPAGQ